MAILGVIEQVDEAGNLLEGEKIIDQAKWHFSRPARVPLSVCF
jgi:hypothetical protein